MKNMLKTFGLHLGVFLILVFTLGVAYAAWDSTVNTGDQLTASSWNELVGKVKTMDSNITFSNGKIGIGTTSPSAKLEIVSDTSLAYPMLSVKASDKVHTDPGLGGFLGFKDQNDMVYGYIGDGSSGRKFGVTTHYGYDLEFSTYTSDTGPSLAGLIIIKGDTGNVGIGTSNPTHRLHVETTETASPTLSLHTPNGWGTLGAHNTSYFHFFTDRPGFYFNKAAYADGGFHTYSDIRIKEDIKNIEDPLEKILKVRGVFYSYKKEGVSPETQNLSRRRQVGVIAQEVEDIFPEVVNTDKKGIKSVDYGKLTPLLIEGMKQQQKQINTLEKAIELLKAK